MYLGYFGGQGCMCDHVISCNDIAYSLINDILITYAPSHGQPQLLAVLHLRSWKNHPSTYPAKNHPSSWPIHQSVSKSQGPHGAQLPSISWLICRLRLHTSCTKSICAMAQVFIPVHISLLTGTSLAWSLTSSSGPLTYGFGVSPLWLWCSAEMDSRYFQRKRKPETCMPKVGFLIL